jgi:hypothetical protein
MRIDDSHDNDGERDETCIDESPEARKKSRVAQVMGEQNLKNQDAKFMSAPNSTKKLRGVNSVNLAPVHKSFKGHKTFT